MNEREIKEDVVEEEKVEVTTGDEIEVKKGDGSIPPGNKISRVNTY